MPPSSGSTAVAVAIGLLAGCLLGIQPSVNGYLGQNVAHPLQATMISFGTGSVVILLLSFALGIFPPSFTVSASTLPWWAWMGGTIGVVMVTSSLFFVPRVGSLVWFAAIMTGQTVIAIVLDHFGLLGNPQSSVTPLRLMGALLLIAGVLLIVQAKRLEQTKAVSDGTPAASRTEWEPSEPQ